MTPTIALFDIDGTLVTCGGAGRRSMTRAFADLGASASCIDFDFGGMTDRAIARRGLRASGRPETDAEIEALIARYLGHLQDELPRSAGFRVLPGVVALLDALRTRPGLALGLGTGNVVRGAATKLAQGGLLGRFAFGGYGCDHEDRAALLAAGAVRGAAQLGLSVEACRVIVLGDTPRDVAAAHAIGASCVAVATGTFGVEALREGGPALVVQDLTSPAVHAWFD